MVVIQNNTGNGLTIASTIADNGSATALTKSGAGTLSLTASNSFTGGVTLNGGTLYLGNNNAIGSSTLTINGGVVSVYNGFTFPNNPIVINNSCTFYVPTAQNFYFGSGPITLNNNATVTLQLGQSPNLANAINNNGYNLTIINTQDGGTTLSGLISAAGGLTIQNNVSGNSKNLIISNAGSTYAGPTTLLAGGNNYIVTSNLSNAGANGSLGAPTGANAIIQINNGVNWLPGGTTNRGVNLASSGTGTVTITVNSSYGNATFNGPITATGAGAKTLYMNMPFNNAVTLTINSAIPDCSDGSPLALNFNPGYNNPGDGNCASFYLNGRQYFLRANQLPRNRYKIPE